MKTICMLSCLHGMYDDRIYWKEAVSLKKAGYNLIHIGASSQELDYVTNEEIRIITIKRKIYFKNPIPDIVFRHLTLRPNIYKKFYLIAKETQADVYHLHDYQLNRIGTKLKKLPHKPKVVYDVHEPYPEIAKFLHHSKGIVAILHNLHSKYIHFLQIKNSQHYDMILATEEIVADYFRKNLSSAQKVHVIYNYCNYSIDKSRSNSIEFDAIYAGGISSWRSVYQFLETAKLAKERNINFKILCVGNVKENGLTDYIESFIQKNKLQEYFVFKKFIPYNELINLYKKSLIGLCLFSNNPVYHIIMPIKIFEYMAMGLPFICNNFGHPARIANLNKCGLCIPNTDPDTILNAILSLKNNPALRKQYALNGIKAYNNQYNWDVMENSLIKLYQNLVH